jgi:aminoglycoside phosphotransferase (APT) family kinase protein
MLENRPLNEAPGGPSARTMPVEQRLQFDSAALERYLGAHIEGLRGPLQVEQFAGGQSNPTYLLTASRGSRFVLRRKPPGKLLPSAHAVDREFVVTRALHSTGFPVARPRLLCDDDSVIGTPFFVTDYVEGRVFFEQSLPELPKEMRAPVWHEMCEIIAALHNTDHRAIGLETFGKPGNYCERQIARWTKQYRASETERIAAMDNLINWLPRNMPPQTSNSVVHGDFRLDNMIFHPTEPKILAVLDWELSTLGDPLADFAYHCLSWHVPPGHFRGIAGLDIAALGLPTEQEHVARYCRLTGRGGIDPAHWDFYIAYNLFRIAAILQGIMKRAVEGTAASAQALDAGRRAKPMAGIGWEYVEGITRRRS